MKKIISLAVLIFLMLASFGCDGDNTSTPSVSKEESEESIFQNVSETVSEEESFSQESAEDEISQEVSEEASEEESVPEISEEVSEETSKEESYIPPQTSTSEPVYLSTGFVLYNGAAYTQSFYVSSVAPRYAAVYEQYADLFPETRINVIIAPLASITILDPSVRISSQSKILDYMEATITGDVNFVNLKNVYVKHAEEYLFFRSDHHWTHRGAYYAYSEFVKSVGITPTPIESFEKTVLCENYIGSMYSFTGDARVKSYYDTVEAYMPTKVCTMTIHNNNGTTSVYNTTVVKNFGNYCAFIAGDHPYITINVPENDQSKSILVIKDSYGNAFVPYLTEHYGNIIVIDPRHTDMNVYENFKDYGLDDIVFLVNSSMGNTSAWCDYFAKLIK